MQRKKWIFIVLIFMVALIITLPNLEVSGQHKITIYYFYNNPCSSCDEEAAFYKEINADLGSLTEGVELECLLYNVFNSGSSARFHNICEKFNIPKENRLTPMVIINGSVLIGQKEIDSKLAIIFSAEKKKVLK